MKLGNQGQSESVQRALTAVRTHLGFDVAFVSQIRDGRRFFVYVDADGTRGPIQVGGSDPVEDSYGHYVVNGEIPELLSDPSQHPVASSLPVTRELPVGTHISVPIELADGSIYGTFSGFSHDIVEMNEHDLAAVRMLSRVVAGYIEEEQAERRETDRRRSRIERLVARSDLTMVFQPIVGLADRTPVGYEALARFPHLDEPTGKVLSDAWELGIGADLEMKAIDAALDASRHLPDGCYVAVNAAPLTLSSTIFYQRIDAADLDPHRLVVEVTEHAAVDDYEALLEAVGRLAGHGVRLAIDDVGTGFAGLSQIIRLSPQIIKIDAALVRDIRHHDDKQAMIAALVTFAGRTGVTLVAEGIENSDECETLQTLGVNLGQGYHFKRPQPLAEILTPQVAQRDERSWTRAVPTRDTAARRVSDGAAMPNAPASSEGA